MVSSFVIKCVDKMFNGMNLLVQKNEMFLVLPVGEPSLLLVVIAANWNINKHQTYKWNPSKTVCSK